MTATRLEDVVVEAGPQGTQVRTGWVLTAEAIVRQRTPGYYEWWDAATRPKQSLAKQFITGLAVLGRISRAL